MGAIRCGWLLLMLLGADRALAAGFDCAKAATAVERSICKDAALSALDDRLGPAYLTALARSDDPESVKSDQLRWLKTRRNACSDSACLRQAYEARLAELADVTPPYESLPDAMDHACMALAARMATQASHCRITETSAFGSLGAETFRYAVYCLDEERTEGAPCQTGGIALFAADAGSKRVRRWHLSSDDGGNVYSAPTILQTPSGLLLHVPVSVQGSGGFNASELFVRQGQRWLRVDSSSWEKDLARRLPKGLAVWKGIWPDFRSFTASVGLYRARDANCCPTGGHAELKLGLQGTRLLLESLSLSPATPR